MPRRNPLEWVDGQGWVVLSGGGAWQYGETDLVDTQVLSIANLDRPMLVMLDEGKRAEAEGILEHYINLGGSGGECVLLSQLKPQHYQAPKLHEFLGEVGLLYLGGNSPLALARALHNTPLIEQIVKGYATLQGLIVMGVGAGAAALGAWVGDPQQPEQDAPGLNFVRSAIIAPHFTDTESAVDLRARLQRHPGFVGLGIPRGTALALGPQGQVETWGYAQITAVVTGAAENV